MKRICVDFEIEVPDNICEGAVDYALDEFLDCRLPEFLEIDDYKVNGRYVHEQ